MSRQFAFRGELMFRPRHEDGPVQSQRSDQHIREIVLQIHWHKSDYGIDLSTTQLLLQFSCVALHKNDFFPKNLCHFHAEIHGQPLQSITTFIQKGQRCGIGRYTYDKMFIPVSVADMYPDRRGYAA